VSHAEDHTSQELAFAPLVGNEAKGKLVQYGEQEKYPTASVESYSEDVAEVCENHKCVGNSNNLTATKMSSRKGNHFY